MQRIMVDLTLTEQQKKKGKLKSGKRKIIYMEAKEL